MPAEIETSDDDRGSARESAVDPDAEYELNDDDLVALGPSERRYVPGMRYDKDSPAAPAADWSRATQRRAGADVGEQSKARSAWERLKRLMAAR